MSDTSNQVDGSRVDGRSTRNRTPGYARECFEDSMRTYASYVAKHPSEDSAANDREWAAIVERAERHSVKL